MRLRHCPPISVLTTPYACVVPSQYHLSLRLISALLTSSRHCLPSLHLRSALPTLLILTLAECPPDTAYHPYARGVPSRHAPDTTYPYACVVPSRHAPDTSYHPYACGVPS
ncbi:hypothetical protein O181_088350 [Austropuccinia psidii MF-1]|uniref:Uncharacterized protein n=1 Tax=Austropuccinia psidii MF-1 TaxID=1389203 RepID=A0A9Q3IRQ2_9BASI|nr:hypothetical protein [Austropuccinia psidii MF-1]